MRIHVVSCTLCQSPSLPDGQLRLTIASVRTRIAAQKIGFGVARMFAPKLAATEGLSASVFAVVDLGGRLVRADDGAHPIVQLRDPYLQGRYFRLSTRRDANILLLTCRRLSFVDRNRAHYKKSSAMHQIGIRSGRVPRGSARRPHRSRVSSVRPSRACFPACPSTPACQGGSGSSGDDRLS